MTFFMAVQPLLEAQEEALRTGGEEAQNKVACQQLCALTAAVTGGIDGGAIAGSVGALAGALIGGLSARQGSTPTDVAVQGVDLLRATLPRS